MYARKFFSFPRLPFWWIHNRLPNCNTKMAQGFRFIRVSSKLKKKHKQSFCAFGCGIYSYCEYTLQNYSQYYFYHTKQKYKNNCHDNTRFSRQERFTTTQNTANPENITKLEISADIK